MIESVKGGSTLPTAAEELAPSGEPAAVAGSLPAHSSLRRWWQREGVSRERAVDLLDDSVRSNAWVPIAMLAVIVAAFLFRVAAAEHLSSHVDEAASVMAAKM